MAEEEPDDPRYRSDGGAEPRPQSRPLAEPAAFDDPLARRIAAFLAAIGIPVRTASLDRSFLPGIAVCEGGLLVDPVRLAWPSDLLHEAGHIAVTDPAERPFLQTVRDDPGEEMAAIAWSYAAAVHLGIAARTLFHDDYKGGGAALAAAFEQGGDVGVPMLQWFGMTNGREDRRRPIADPYPHMLRWLR